MGFRIIQKENLNFNSPQEMYNDYKRRKINGPLDYQSEMIDTYMNSAFAKTDVALELPTGSGKTLIGLLIGEFRRKKYHEKVVYLCPTNQLVNQTFEQAHSKYGIKVQKFTGAAKKYDVIAKGEYAAGQVIAITNYSSFFNSNTFFSDADVVLLDDAHSAENYIASLWTMEISRFEHKQLFLQIAESLKGDLDNVQYYRLVNEPTTSSDYEWFDKVPNVTMLKHWNNIFAIIDANVENTKLIYSWNNIKEHLHACNIFLSWDKILIRPFIPPTLTHPAFANAKQRIYMSATLGESGELERITGVPSIFRLKIVRDWDNKGIGRRFFLFPGLSFSSQDYGDIILKINDISKRALILVPDDKNAQKFSEFIKGNSDAQVFSSKEIELSKNDFVNSSKAVAVLANRFDGIDFVDDECRMLILITLANATHLQEKFFISKLAASVLFNERIKTRIVQAIGRCTRNPVDYSAVCIFGHELMNELISPHKLSQYHPELQAEIEFGKEQSTSQSDIDQYLNLLKLFFARGDEWEQAEQAIINLRDEKIAEKTLTPKVNFSSLMNSVKHEVNFQYLLWKKDYETAYGEVEKIINLIGNDHLQGYKCFWLYVAGYIAYNIYLQGKQEYLEVAKKCFKAASSYTNAINWFNKLVKEDQQDNECVEDNFIYDVLERLEKQIVKYGVKESKKFETKARDILTLLNSTNGLEFERGHKELGEFLGYIADNAKGDADPDPWWIINDEYCIVAEDKIYESDDKLIPPNHVKQANGHEKWIKEKITLSSKANIDTIFITNARTIQTSAAVFGNDVWYVNKYEFIEWARQAIDCVRQLRQTFTEEGDLDWRKQASRKFSGEKLSPKDLILKIKRTKLSELPKG